MMEAYLWLIGIALLAVIGGGLFFAIQRPDFVAGLVKAFVSMAIKAILPFILKPETPEAREKRIEAFKRNEVPATKQRKHPNEGGHR